MGFVSEAALHPAILSIAVDIIIYPAHRIRYSEVILGLADRAIAILRQQLQESRSLELAKPPLICAEN